MHRCLNNFIVRTDRLTERLTPEHILWSQNFQFPFVVYVKFEMLLRPTQTCKNQTKLLCDSCVNNFWFERHLLSHVYTKLPSTNLVTNKDWHLGIFCYFIISKLRSLHTLTMKRYYSRNQFSIRIPKNRFYLGIIFLHIYINRILVQTS